MKQNLIRLFCDSAGVLLLSLASLLFVTNCLSLGMVHPKEPVLSLPISSLFWIVGSFQIFVALTCFFVRDLWFKLMLVFWLALILMAYWWCFVREAPAGLRGYLGNVCEVFEISPRTAEIILKGANSYLMAGSVAAIIWLSLNKLFARIESEPEIKMVCCNCGGKIAFPGRAIGMNILCPHCANVLILRKP